MSNLPYKVECKRKGGCFEVIAAFNCKSAAEAYAGECAMDNMSLFYRIKYGRKIICELGPE